MSISYFRAEMCPSNGLLFMEIMNSIGRERPTVDRGKLSKKLDTIV
jgi:hypothetical protein